MYNLNQQVTPHPLSAVRLDHSRKGIVGSDGMKASYNTNENIPKSPTIRGTRTWHEAQGYRTPAQVRDRIVKAVLLMIMPLPL